MLSIKQFNCSTNCGNTITEAQYILQNKLCDNCFAAKRMFSLEEVKTIVREEILKFDEVRNAKGEEEEIKESLDQMKEGKLSPLKELNDDEKITATEP